MSVPDALPRIGWLKNGNRPGRFTDARRCGARTRSSGRPCQMPAVHGKRRCRLHGGLSTGPKTPAGLERSRRARWKHGRYSVERRRAIARARAEVRAFNLRAQAARQALIEAMPILRRVLRCG